MGRDHAPRGIGEQDAGAVMALGPVAFTQELGLGNTALHFAAFYGAAEVHPVGTLSPRSTF